MRPRPWYILHDAYVASSEAEPWYRGARFGGPHPAGVSRDASPTLRGRAAGLKQAAGGEAVAMKVLFDNAEYDGQLLRALAYTYYGGADVGECLTTARRITEGDDDGWYREWCATADRVYAAAEASRA